MILRPQVSHLKALKLIKGFIDYKIPFNLTRLGDGEICVLKNLDPSKYDTGITYGFLKTHWGINYGTDDYKKLRNIMFKSVENSNFLGIYNFQKRFKDHDKTNNRICAKWRIEEDFFVKKGIDISDKWLVDFDFVRSYVFGIVENFLKHFDGIKIDIVTSTGNILKDPRLVNNKNINIIYVDKDLLFKDIDIENILDKITGDLVIYGLSTGLKDFGVIVKNTLKKSAIDVGSLMLAWSGVSPRGIYDIEFAHAINR